MLLMKTLLNKSKQFNFLKMKKVTSIVVLMSLIALAASIPDELPSALRLVQEVGPPISADDGQLKALEQSLESAGVVGLLNATREVAPGGCPTIYSQGYCDRLNAGTQEDKERAKHEIRVRNFGRRILEALDRESVELTKRRHLGSEFRAQAECLLALGDWVLKGDGIGNGIIASRFRLLAALAAANVVVDESMPVADASALVDSLRNFGEVDWFKWQVRAHEREAAGAIAPFVRKADTPNAIRQSLLSAALRGNSILKDMGVGRAPRGPGELEAIRQVRLGLDPKIAIYLEDPLTGVTTVEQWDLSRLIREPLHTRILEDLEGTLLFRQSVGGFPLQPLPENAIKDGKLSEFYTSRTHAAFSRAWEEFCYRKEFLNSDLKKDPITGKTVVDPTAEKLSIKYLNLGADHKAARIYDAVKQSRFENYLLGDSPKH